MEQSGEVRRFEPPRALELNDRYARRFGLDREIGRRVIAEHYGVREQADGEREGDLPSRKPLR